MDTIWHHEAMRAHKLGQGQRHPEQSMIHEDTTQQTNWLYLLLLAVTMGFLLINVEHIALWVMFLLTYVALARLLPSMSGHV